MNYTVGDTFPGLVGTVPDDITGATVTVTLQRPSRTLLVKPATVTDGPTGAWRAAPWGPADLDESGTWWVTTNVVFVGGQDRTYGPTSMYVAPQLLSQGTPPAPVAGYSTTPEVIAKDTAVLVAAQASSAQRAANLADLASPAAARTNLGLGTAATAAATAFDTAGAATAAQTTAQTYTDTRVAAAVQIAYDTDGVPYLV